MKKFICVVPQQREGSLYANHYEPVGNRRLAYGDTRFPVMPMINGYVQPGEEFRVIAILQDYDCCYRNLEYLEEELAALTQKKGLNCPNGVETIQIPFSEALDTHLETFQKLIAKLDDDDDLYACITYGSKTVPLVEIMALKYAYRIKRNASIGCIVYGQMDRTLEPPKPRIFDVTALIQLDEIVRMCADQGIQDPEGLINQILTL